MEAGKDSHRSNYKKRKSIAVGPWGGNGGTGWDDGTHNGVREIRLVYDHCIDSISVVYDKNGKPFAGEKHGGNGGSHTAEIKLQYLEYLVSVSGHYCPVVNGGGQVIRSLTFKTNKQTFGPYGIEQGTPFTLPIDGGLVVGFRGRSGWYLDAIGCHVSPLQSTAKLVDRFQKGLKRLASTAASKPLLARTTTTSTITNN